MGRTTSTKKNTICDEIRSQIVSGKYAPKDRLPSRAALKDAYHASPVTLQRAMDQLRDEGFIVADGPFGTRVAERPPHLSHYIICFREHPSSAEWLAYERTLKALAEGIESANKMRFSFAFAHSRLDQVEETRQIANMVTSGRNAGLIFAAPPDLFVGTSIISIPNMPRVGLHVRCSQVDACVHLDTTECSRRSYEMLAHMGACQPAVFIPTSNTWNGETKAQLAASANAFGLKVDAPLVQGVPLTNHAFVGELIELLFALPPEHQPDGFLITDDNLVPAITAQLSRHPRFSPGTHPVVAHANFPEPTPCHVPAHRIGFDLEAALTMCTNAVNCLRSGRKVSKLQVLPPQERLQLP